MRSPCLTLIAALTLWACGGEPADPNRFRHGALGIELTKPDSWHLRAARPNTDALASGEALAALAREHRLVPVVEISAVPEPASERGDARVTVRTGLYGELAGKSAVEILNTVVIPMTSLTSAELAQAPMETRLGGMQAGYARLIMHAPTGEDADHDGQEDRIPTTIETWLVPTETFYFMIGATTRRDGEPAEHDAATRAVESIRFAWAEAT